MFGKQEASAYLGRQFKKCRSELINQRGFPGSAALVFGLGWRLEVEDVCSRQGVLRGDIG